jgi:hypothetical protein
LPRSGTWIWGLAGHVNRQRGARVVQLNPVETRTAITRPAREDNGFMNSLRIGRTLIAAALLAALGVAGMPSPIALATSQPVLNWAKQSPTASPSARDYASIAYDAATGNVVLFGGHGSGVLGDTWVWDGSAWTQQHPAASPPARWGAAMAYDAATGNVVLFSGFAVHNVPRDTWVWGSSG